MEQKNQMIIGALGLVAGAAFLLSRRGAQAAPPSDQLAPGQQLAPGMPSGAQVYPFEAPDDAYNIDPSGAPPSSAPGTDPYQLQPGTSPSATPRADGRVKPEPKPTVIPATQVTRGALIVPVTAQPTIT
jgi:hypothetical protein